MHPSTLLARCTAWFERTPIARARLSSILALLGCVLDRRPAQLCPAGTPIDIPLDVIHELGGRKEGRVSLPFGQWHERLDPIPLECPQVLNRAIGGVGDDTRWPKSATR